MTPEREAEIRARPPGEPSYEPSDTMIRELLAALDAERVARAAAEKERDQLRKAIARITKTPVYEKRGEPASGISLAMIRAIREAAESAGLEPWVSHRDPLAAAASKEPAA